MCGLEAEEALLRGVQVGVHLRQPAGVADVPGADDVDAFALRPQGEVGEVQVLAGGPGEVGVDVEVGG